MVFVIRGSHGSGGNFELVLPRAGGGLDHWWRDNDAAGRPWRGPTLAFGSALDVTGAALVQSTFGRVGNLETVYREGDRLRHAWRDDGGDWRWHGPTWLPGRAAGAGPALLRGGHGVAGNFEVVAPLPGGGLGHWWRDNDAPGLPWHGPTRFGSGAVAAVCLAQEGAGALEAVGRIGARLLHWSRPGTGAWTRAAAFADGAAGDPAMVAGGGGLDVLTPLAAGGVGHWWRAGGGRWQGPQHFGAGQVAAVGLLRDADGALHAVARRADRLEHWTAAPGTRSWVGPTVFGTDPFDPVRHGGTALPYRTGVVGIHAALLHTGDVLLFGFADTDDTHGESRLLDPRTGVVTAPAGSPDAFCSGHAFLADGRLLVVGGHHHDVRGLHTFDPGAGPGSGAWRRLGELPAGRWYPTCATLPDGRVLAVSGTLNGGPVGPQNPVNHTLQLLPAGPVRPLPAPFSDHFPPGLPTIDLYPFVHLLPDGRLLVHSRHVTRWYDPATDTWDPTELTTVHPAGRSYPGAGASVLLPLLPTDGYRPRVLLAGGAGADPEALTADTPATTAAELLDAGAATPAWRRLPPMAHPRVMPDATLLPDGTVLVLGGSATGRADVARDPVLPAELFDPATERWTSLRTLRVPRLYHASALLLPDARVLVLGKDGLFNPAPYDYPEHRAELVSPPYLFRGARPVVTAVPDRAGYDEPVHVSVDDPGRVAAVNLVRPGAVTHSVDMTQRLVGLVVTARSATGLTLRTPPDANVAPPGYYLLFALSADGVPSEGRFIRLG